MQPSWSGKGPRGHGHSAVTCSVSSRNEKVAGNKRDELYSDQRLSSITKPRIWWHSYSWITGLPDLSQSLPSPLFLPCICMSPFSFFSLIIVWKTSLDPFCNSSTTCQVCPSWSPDHPWHGLGLCLTFCYTCIWNWVDFSSHLICLSVDSRLGALAWAEVSGAPPGGGKEWELSQAGFQGNRI